MGYTITNKLKCWLFGHNYQFVGTVTDHFERGVFKARIFENDKKDMWCIRGKHK